MMKDAKKDKENNDDKEDGDSDTTVNMDDEF